MRVSAQQLLPPRHGAYYLHGEDEDAIFEMAEALLAGGEGGAVRLRVDVSELARIEEESRSQGLFGPACCYALVRNAGSATPKQSEHLLRMAADVRPENRIIFCAAGIDWKKALHKKMRAIDSVAECEFPRLDEAAFSRWLAGEIEASGLNVTPDVVAWVAERLCGMRMAARQLIARMRDYDGDQGQQIGLSVIGELLGERAPGELEGWCHAVAMRDGRALGMARRLLSGQQVAAVQMISWLGTRMQQLLMYRWFHSQRDRNPLAAARVFGDARKLVDRENRNWSGPELSRAVQRIIEAEKLIKGASIEEDDTVIERLTLELVDRERLAT